jgi:hypothetical protein
MGEKTPLKQPKRNFISTVGHFQKKKIENDAHLFGSMCSERHFEQSYDSRCDQHHEMGLVKTNQ